MTLRVSTGQSHLKENAGYLPQTKLITCPIPIGEPMMRKKFALILTIPFLFSIGCATQQKTANTRIGAFSTKKRNRNPSGIGQGQKRGGGLVPFPAWHKVPNSHNWRGLPDR